MAVFRLPGVPHPFTSYQGLVSFLRSSPGYVERQRPYLESQFAGALQDAGYGGQRSWRDAATGQTSTTYGYGPQDLGSGLLPRLAASGWNRRLAQPRAVVGVDAPIDKGFLMSALEYGPSFLPALPLAGAGTLGRLALAGLTAARTASRASAVVSAFKRK